MHYNGANGYTPIPPYSPPTITEPGFKTLTATGVTTATQLFATLAPEYTNDPPSYYSAFAYALSPTGSSVNATFDSGGGVPNFSMTSITATLTTTVPNCFGIIFVFNDGTVGPLPALTPPAGWTADSVPLVNTYPPMGGGAGMIAWHSTSPLPVGTTTVVVPNPTSINLLVEGVAIAP